MIEAHATARYIRTSAQKAGLVLALIRGKDVNHAVTTLTFRVVDGTVDGGSTHFTTPDGLTYELSTSPGAPGSANADPGQAIYAAAPLCPCG